MMRNRAELDAWFAKLPDADKMTLMQESNPRIADFWRTTVRGIAANAGYA